MTFHTRRRLVFGLCLLFAMLAPMTGSADERGLLWWSDDLSGMRESVAAQGMNMEVAYIGEFVRNLDPGLVSPRKDTIYQDNLDLIATLDTEQAGMWSGGTFFVYGLFNHGGFPSASLIGDLQAASNIEASRNQFILHEAWYEQDYSDGAVSLLAGLHDLNGDFYGSEYAALFINSSFGIGPEVSGNVPTSLFPQASWGLRARVSPGGHWYVQAAVYDGDPATRSMSGIQGYMSIFEAGLTPGGGNSYKAGVWHHSADRTVAGQTFGSDYGVYGLADQRLLSLQGGRELGGFLQLGWVPKQRNDITRYLGAGLHLSGLPLRAGDELGLAVGNAYTRGGTEHVIELTWWAPLLAGVSVQPSMQWIMNPGGNAAAGIMRVALLRFVVVL